MNLINLFIFDYYRYLNIIKFIHYQKFFKFYDINLHSLNQYVHSL